MTKGQLHSWGGVSSPNHDNENYDDVPIPLVGLVGFHFSGVEEVKDEKGKIIGHDSHSSHEDVKDARIEVEAMKRNLKQK